MDLVGWSWTFLLLYVALMVGIGVLGQRRVSTADDFATARSSYGPLFLAFAFAATVASGATFLGLPGISYTAGLSAIWSSVLYPVGVYLGVLICIRLVRRAGHVYGSRSIPEYLGERYDSDLIRILVSIFSLLLLFYLAGQLVAGLVMFEMMLGLSSAWALLITGGVLLIYVLLGGAHADILTDGIQGAVMVGPPAPRTGRPRARLSPRPSTEPDKRAPFTLTCSGRTGDLAQFGRVAWHSPGARIGPDGARKWR